MQILFVWQEKRPLDAEPNQNLVYFYYYSQSARHPDSHEGKGMWTIGSNSPSLMLQENITCRNAQRLLKTNPALPGPADTMACSPGPAVISSMRECPQMSHWVLVFWERTSCRAALCHLGALLCQWAPPDSPHLLPEQLRPPSLSL